MKSSVPDQAKPPPPRVRILAPDPIYGGRYSVRCECGRVWMDWVDALPVITCPGCGVRAEAKELRDQKRDERWA